MCSTSPSVPTSSPAAPPPQPPRKEFAVEIRLAGDDDAPWKTFLIYGAEEDAAAAREALELKSVEYPLSDAGA